MDGQVTHVFNCDIDLQFRILILFKTRSYDSINFYLTFQGFQNSRKEVSVVQLKVSCPGNPESKTDTVAEGQPYRLRAEVLKYDGMESIYIFFL